MAKKPKAAADSHACSGRRPGQSNQVRIIGGVHRGRKLRFPDHQGLRPTSDRTRETLFNWLQPYLPGARVLDLFAGSGVLGFEAASRGAAEVVMVEQSPKVVQQLIGNRDLLGLDSVLIQQANALAWLESGSRQFDIVFLDPPFADGLLGRSCERLQAGGWLASGSRIYIEKDAAHALPEIPPQWDQLKQKRAGQVDFYLFSA
jgi:16S rRNA (guanine966-N2)-methyltransferase